MPEGDTVYAAARRLDEALAGHVVVRSDIRVPAFATVDFTGQVVHSVASRGKHLLMRIGDDVLHSHLKMEGEWRVSRAGERRRRPDFRARAIIETDDAVAVGSDLGVVEVFPASEEAERMAYLGPDLLGPDWDAAEAVRRLAADPAAQVVVALAEQRNLAGPRQRLRQRAVLPARHPPRPTDRRGRAAGRSSRSRAASSGPIATASSARPRATRAAAAGSGSTGAAANRAAAAARRSSTAASAATRSSSATRTGARTASDDGCSVRVAPVRPASSTNRSTDAAAPRQATGLR